MDVERSPVFVDGVVGGVGLRMIVPGRGSWTGWIDVINVGKEMWGREFLCLSQKFENGHGPQREVLSFCVWGAGRRFGVQAAKHRPRLSDGNLTTCLSHLDT